MKELYNRIQQHIQETGFSGIVSIYQEDQPLFQEWNGYRDRANELPMTKNTRCGIASGTKLFTACGIMKLIEQQKLSLHDPMNKWITTDFPTYDPSITILHLLTHTSGLPDYFDEELELPTMTVPWYDLHKPSDYLAVMPHREMKFKPGTSFNYNNSAFVFLAIIIENITGDYHRFITEEILVPTGMNASGFFKMNELPKNTALGYVDPKNNPYKTNIFDLPIVGGGDGGMFVTVCDMHRFWTAFMGGDIVSTETVHQMIKPHSASSSLFYGLGVWLEKQGDDYLPHIVGQDPGVSFESGYDPKTKKSYVIVSNTEHGVWPISTLLKQSR